MIRVFNTMIQGTNALYKRNITPSIITALSDTPVVLINGARQTGKSTLCKALIEDPTLCSMSLTWQTVTLDDPTTLLAARQDPLGFLKDLEAHVIIDEIQRATELFLPIKMLVDENRRGRRFILSGSANVMMMPRIGDSLAGRIEIHTLWPLSQDELLGTPSTFLHTLTNPDKPFASLDTPWSTIADFLMRGGYPEAVERNSLERRNQWFKDYLTAILQKDIREITEIDGLNDLPNLLRLIAIRVGSTMNMSDVGRLAGIKNTTLQRYLALLEHTFMIHKIPAWTKNTEGQLVKSPKIYLNDTGLFNHLMGLEDETFFTHRRHAGASLENFVVMEIIKQLSWYPASLKPYHFSLHKGAEVDLVLEDARGGLYGIEITSAAQLQSKDFKGLTKFKTLAGEKFKRGIVFYTGDKYLGGFGENLQAVPLSALWQA